MPKVKWKANGQEIQKLKQKVADAYGQVVATLNDEFDAVISDENEFADLGFVDQDIIDTSRFLNSKTVTTKTNSDGSVVALWEWNPHSPENGFAYAPGLHNGFMAFGKKYIPGRPWTERAIARVDPIKALHAEMKLRGLPAKIRKKYTFF